MKSIIAPVQLIIFVTFQTHLYQTSGFQSISFISTIAFSHQAWLTAVIVVIPSSAIEIFTLYSLSIL
ncbi:MAG: hypothetical protein LBU14_02565 [Candidatus Peribacteria bacterium]|nr:hypothetical protein [Candidatus Peribacteria bacterium]